MKPYSLHLRSLKRGLTMISGDFTGNLVFIETIIWQTISGSLMLRNVEYEDNISGSARVAIGR